MNKKSSNPFDEIITAAKNFVEKQKGMWDHTRWENFISEVRKKGVSVTEETSKLIGSMLESLKKLYASGPQFEEIINNAKAFVEKQKGMWDHTRWENFISEVQKKGVSVSEETSKLIGSVLESLKKLYTSPPRTGEVEVEDKKTDTQPSSGESETAVIEKPETPMVKKPETPIVKKTSQPLEIKKEPEIKTPYQEKETHPRHKSLHQKPKKIKKHPRLLRQKTKGVAKKK